MVVNSFIFNFKKQLKFIRNLFIFLLIIATCDRLLGICLEHLYRSRYRGGFVGKVNQLIANQSQVIIMGDSRAEYHYIPQIISNETNLSVYNMGEAGQSIFFFFVLQELIFEKYIPEVIVLDLKLSLIYGDNKKPLERLSPVLPYCHNKKIFELLCERSKFEHIKLQSKLYPYNSYVLPILKYSMQNERQSVSSYLGYKPVFGNEIGRLDLWDDNDSKEEKTNLEIDPLKFEIFRKFIQNTLQNNVKLIIVLGPFWKPGKFGYNRKIEYYNNYKDLFSKFSIPFIEITKNDAPQFSNPEFYNDYRHFNNDGAHIFSKIVGRRLFRKIHDLDSRRNLETTNPNFKNRENANS